MNNPPREDVERLTSHFQKLWDQALCSTAPFNAREWATETLAALRSPSQSDADEHAAFVSAMTPEERRSHLHGDFPEGDEDYRPASDFAQSDAVRQAVLADVDRTIRLCEERAETYGDHRRSSLTAIALDSAASQLRALSRSRPLPDQPASPVLGDQKKDLADAFSGFEMLREHFQPASPVDGCGQSAISEQSRKVDGVVEAAMRLADHFTDDGLHTPRFDLPTGHQQQALIDLRAALTAYQSSDTGESRHAD